MHKHPLFRAIGVVVGYTFCLWAVRLIFLTIVTYVFVRSNEALQKVGDVVQANQILAFGFSAILFSALLQTMHPLTRTNFREIFNLDELRSCFSANALGGFMLGAVLILGTLLGGHISWLGIYMRFDEVALSLASATLFSTCLFVMAIVEEYLFRQALEPKLSEYLGPALVSVTSCVLFVFLKGFQFHLDWLAAINFTLLNLTLSNIAKTERTHMASASFLGTFLVILHTLFGLPLLGQDMPGICLLRADHDDGLSRLLAGGNEGPENGLVLTVLLMIYLYLPQIRSKGAFQKS